MVTMEAYIHYYSNEEYVIVKYKLYHIQSFRYILVKHNTISNFHILSTLTYFWWGDTEHRVNIDLGSTSQSCQIYFQWLCNQYILLLLNPIIIVYIKLMMYHINQTLYLTIHSFSFIITTHWKFIITFNNFFTQ